MPPPGTVHNDPSLELSRQLCPVRSEEARPWYQRKNLRLAPYCWPLVAFGPAALFFFFMTLGSCAFLFVFALLLGEGGVAFALLAPLVVFMGLYPGFCSVWKRISNRRDLGLRIELVPAKPDADPQDPYRALQKPSAYRVWYRGKVIEKGPITPGSLVLRTYYFRPDAWKSAPDHVTSLVLRSRVTKAPIWWFAFARHFEDGAYVLAARSTQGSAELCKQTLALQERLGLPESSIPHHYEYASAQAEKLVNQARALTKSTA